MHERDWNAMKKSMAEVAVIVIQVRSSAFISWVGLCVWLLISGSCGRRTIRCLRHPEMACDPQLSYNVIHASTRTHCHACGHTATRTFDMPSAQ